MGDCTSDPRMASWQVCVCRCVCVCVCVDVSLCVCVFVQTTYFGFLTASVLYNTAIDSAQIIYQRLIEEDGL